MNDLLKYRSLAIKRAVICHLGADEGYVAKIPGFRGLLAVGSSKRAAFSELRSALDDWMSLALKRGIGLPALTRVNPGMSRQGEFPIQQLAAVIKKVKWDGWTINEEERLSGEKPGEKAVAPARQTLKQVFGK